VKNESQPGDAIKKKETFGYIKAPDSTTPDTFIARTPRTFYPKLVHSIRRAMVGWVLYLKNLGGALAEAVSTRMVKLLTLILVLLNRPERKKSQMRMSIISSQIHPGKRPWPSKLTNF